MALFFDDYNNNDNKDWLS